MRGTEKNRDPTFSTLLVRDQLEPWRDIPPVHRRLGKRSLVEYDTRWFEVCMVAVYRSQFAGFTN